MSRPLLTSSSLSSEASQAIASFHSDIVKEVSDAVAKFPVVVVGMKQNPVVKS